MTPLATVPSKPTQTAQDYVPAVDVRWRQGCGDYAILSTIQTVFPTLGITTENFAMVAGVGCSSVSSADECWFQRGILSLGTVLSWVSTHSKPVLSFHKLRCYTYGSNRAKWNF